MNKPRVYIDFNGMISADLILLSRTDSKEDSSGEEIVFYEGKKISVYMDDIDENGERDDLIADGVVELNHSGVFPLCKWLFRVDEKGIRNESQSLK